MVGGSLVSWPNHLGIVLVQPNGGEGFPAITLCSDAPFNDGAYHHVAASFDGSSRTLTGYFDGQPSGFIGADFDGNPAGTPVGPGQVRNVSFPGVNWGLPLYFGTTYQRFFPLELDEVDFFNRALSGTEIQTIFVAESAGKCK
jgi:hypothetical protein